MKIWKIKRLSLSFNESAPFRFWAERKNLLILHLCVYCKKIVLLKYVLYYRHNKKNINFFASTKKKTKLFPTQYRHTVMLTVRTFFVVFNNLSVSLLFRFSRPQTHEWSWYAAWRSAKLTWSRSRSLQGTRRLQGARWSYRPALRTRRSATTAACTSSTTTMNFIHCTLCTTSEDPNNWPGANISGPTVGRIRTSCSRWWIH